jgi:hypothetical protein
MARAIAPGSSRPPAAPNAVRPALGSQLEKPKGVAMRALTSGWTKAGVATAIAVTASTVWILGGPGQAQAGSFCIEVGSHAGFPGNFQVDDPMEMNSVLVGKDLVKTIKVDKQIWACEDDGDGQFDDRIVDVQIYVEIVEQVLQKPPHGGGPQFPVLAKRFEVVTCEKVLPDNLADTKCQVQDPAPDDSLPDLTACNTGQEDGTRSPSHPLELNTVVVGEVVKTIKAQKEMFDCAGAGTDTLRVIDLETFTEIFEAGPLLEPVLKRVKIAVCATSGFLVQDPAGLAHPFVTNCHFMPEQVIFP